MHIQLQKKTTAMNGWISEYTFEDAVKPGRYCKVEVPLQAFNPGLPESTPQTQTSFVIEWLPAQVLELKVGESIRLVDEGEGSIYLGNKHNPLIINGFAITRMTHDTFRLMADFEVDFAHEGVAEKEDFDFQTELTLADNGH